jgi:hypothetical protein
VDQFIVDENGDFFIIGANLPTNVNGTNELFVAFPTSITEPPEVVDQDTNEILQAGTRPLPISILGTPTVNLLRGNVTIPVDIPSPSLAELGNATTFSYFGNVEESPWEWFWSYDRFTPDHINTRFGNRTSDPFDVSEVYKNNGQNYPFNTTLQCAVRTKPRSVTHINSAQPVVTQVSPNPMRAGISTEVTLTGANLSDVRNIRVGGSPNSLLARANTNDDPNDDPNIIKFSTTQGIMGDRAIEVFDAASNPIPLAAPVSIRVSNAPAFVTLPPTVVNGSYGASGGSVTLPVTINPKGRAASLRIAYGISSTALNMEMDVPLPGSADGTTNISVDVQLTGLGFSTYYYQFKIRNDWNGNDASGNAVWLTSSTRQIAFSTLAGDFVSAEQPAITANGINLGNGTTSVTLDIRTPVRIGQVLTLVDNVGDSAIAGSLTNLPDEGSITYTVDGTTYKYIADYQGGDGNDLTLTRVPNAGQQVVTQWTNAVGLPGGQGSAEGTWEESSFRANPPLAIDSSGNAFLGTHTPNGHKLRRVGADDMITSLQTIHVDNARFLKTIAAKPDGSAVLVVKGTTANTTDALPAGEKRVGLINPNDGTPVVWYSQTTINPKGVVFNADGSRFFGTSGHMVQGYDSATGAVDAALTIGASGTAGLVSGTRSAARFHTPTGICRQGNFLYVLQLKPNTLKLVVRKIDLANLSLASAVTTPWPLVEIPVSAATVPAYIAVDASDRWIITNGTTQVFIGQGNSTPAPLGSATPGFADSGAPGGPQFEKPAGVALHPDGYFMLVDGGPNRGAWAASQAYQVGDIVTYSNNTYCCIAPHNSSGTSLPTNVANWMTRGNAQGNGSMVRGIAINGTVSTIAGRTYFRGSDSGIAEEGRLTSPGNLHRRKLANGETILVTNNTSTIREIFRSSTTSGIGSLAGEASSPWSVRSLLSTGPRRAYDVAIDRNGVAYYLDKDADCIFTIGNDGTHLVVVGQANTENRTDGTGTAARFTNPIGITYDGSTHALFVADGNGLIRKIALPDKVVSTIAGVAPSTTSVDGTGTAARFKRVTGIRSDGNGILYISDDIKMRKMVLGTGQVTTIYTRSGTTMIGSVKAVTKTGRLFLGKPALVLPTEADASMLSELVLSPSVSLTNVAGDGTQGWKNGQGVNALFGQAEGVALASDGSIFLSDSRFHRVSCGVACTAPIIAAVSTAIVTPYQTSASITVNPNGMKTTVTLAWGLAPDQLSPPITSHMTGTGNQTLEHTMPGLAPDTLYYYAVIASNPDGIVQSLGTFTSGNFSNSPRPLADLSTIADPGVIRLVITNPLQMFVEDNPANYWIERSSDNGVTYSPITANVTYSADKKTAWDLNVNPGAFYQYRVQLRHDDGMWNPLPVVVTRTASTNDGFILALTAPGLATITTPATSSLNLTASRSVNGALGESVQLQALGTTGNQAQDINVPFGSVTYTITATGAGGFSATKLLGPIAFDQPTIIATQLELGGVKFTGAPTGAKISLNAQQSVDGGPFTLVTLHRTSPTSTSPNAILRTQVLGVSVYRVTVSAGGTWSFTQDLPPMNFSGPPAISATASMSAVGVSNATEATEWTTPSQEILLSGSHSITQTYPGYTFAFGFERSNDGITWFGVSSPDTASAFGGSPASVLYRPVVSANYDGVWLTQRRFEGTTVAVPTLSISGFYASVNGSFTTITLTKTGNTGTCWVSGHGIGDGYNTTGALWISGTHAVALDNTLAPPGQWVTLSYNLRIVGGFGYLGTATRNASLTFFKPLPAPSGLTAQALDPSSGAYSPTVLTWNYDNSIPSVSFRVFRSQPGYGESDLGTGGSLNGFGAFEYQDTSTPFNPNTTYTYRVRAENNNGSSPNSTSVEFTTGN